MIREVERSLSGRLEPTAVSMGRLGLCAALIVLLGLTGVSLAGAAEGGLGRPITGMQVLPFAGVIPPDPGFVWQLGYLYYSGDLGGERSVPIGGQLAVDLEAELSLFTATGIYVWKTTGKRWNYGSMLTVPYIWVDVAAEVVLDPVDLDILRQDSAAGLFDLYFAPIIASYHVSQVEHWSFGLYVYAPTADYELGKLANPGLNVWTMTPAVGYTRLFKKGTLEFSALSGVEFYTENDATDYQNGEIFRLDLLVMKRYESGWGIGLVGGWIEQLSGDDGGRLTEVTDGFKGRAFGLGPAISYTHKTEAENQIDFNFRWVPEFGVENRFEGGGLLLTVGFNF
jgi:hypothetical protein